MKANSEVLIVSSDLISTSAIECELENCQLRYKTAKNIAAAEAWLDVRTFGLLIIVDSFGSANIANLAQKAWTLNKAARVVIIGVKGSTSIESLLIGAEVILGPDYLPELKQLLIEYLDFVSITAAPAHILVVEDLDSPRDIICMFLEGMGYTQVTGVASAKEALDLLNDNPARYTTIITDVRMPQMSGAELIKEVRRSADFNRLPIIALTAYGTIDCLFECLEVGASGFLVKPPKKVDLQRELNRAERVRLAGASSRLVGKDQIEQLQKIIHERGLI